LGDVFGGGLSGIVRGGPNVGDDISGQLPSSAPYRAALNTILDNVARAVDASLRELDGAVAKLDTAWSAPPSIGPSQGRVAETYAIETTESFAKIRSKGIDPARMAAASLRQSAGDIRARKA